MPARPFLAKPIFRKSYKRKASCHQKRCPLEEQWLEHDIGKDGRSEECGCHIERYNRHF